MQQRVQSDHQPDCSYPCFVCQRILTHLLELLTSKSHFQLLLQCACGLHKHTWLLLQKLEASDVLASLLGKTVIFPVPSSVVQEVRHQ